jgi:predicted DNA-binding WGR domain protein
MPVDFHDRDEVSLVKINPELNQRRFYVLDCSLDLFGQAVLTRRYGRIGRSCQVKIESFPDMEAALGKREKLTRAKRRRGYIDRGTPAGQV